MRILLAAILLLSGGLLSLFAADPNGSAGEPAPLRVWKAQDGSKWVWVQGQPHRISLPTQPFDWRDHLAYNRLHKVQVVARTINVGLHLGAAISNIVQ